MGKKVNITNFNFWEEAYYWDRLCSIFFSTRSNIYIYIFYTRPCLQLLEVRMQSEFSEVESPDPGGEQTPTLPNPGTSSSPQESDPPTQPSTGNNSCDGPRDNIPCLQYGLYILWKTWNNCSCLKYVAGFLFFCFLPGHTKTTETSLNIQCLFQG